MTFRLTLLISLLASVLIVPSIHAQEPDVSFELSSDDGNVSVDDAHWRVQMSDTRIYFGQTFDLIIDGATDAGDTYLFAIQYIPYEIESGTYDLQTGTSAVETSEAPLIGIRYVVRSSNGSGSGSNVNGTITLARDGDVLAGSFEGSLNGGQNVTATFTNITIPDITDCYLTGTPEGDAVVSAAFESDTTYFDLNTSMDATYWTNAYSIASDFFDEVENPSVNLFFHTAEAPLDGAVIAIKHVPYPLETGDYVTATGSFVESYELLGIVTSVEALSYTDRELQGTITISEMGEDTFSGSYTFDILGDDFFDDTEDVVGSISGTFTDLPIPADTCGVMPE